MNYTHFLSTCGEQLSHQTISTYNNDIDLTSDFLVAN